MARRRTHTRRHACLNPRGVLDVRPGGFGFVYTAEGGFFIPEAKIAGAFDGDLVEVAPLPTQPAKGTQKRSREASSPQTIDETSKHPGGLPAARVVRVLDRAHDTVVGRYEVAEPFGVVVPVDPKIHHDIFTMRADRPDIEDGALVRVRITTFPARNTAATGVVEEVLGRADDDDALVELIIARHKFETEFSAGALEQARAAKVDEIGALAQGYRDLRDRFVFTIDPADARDFDDALSIDPVVSANDGVSEAARWRVGVHIADVSHYVPWNSSIDLDARRRATSVYLVDRVIPMLPEELSNELCSLKPGEVRRSMTVDLYVDDNAHLVTYDIYPALIRSDARLSYDEAQVILDGACGGEEQALQGDAGCSQVDASCSRGETDRSQGDESVECSIALRQRLQQLSHIAQARALQRTQAGGIDFVTAEAKVRLDKDKHPTGIEVRRKTQATSLVEEAMIFANETVATHLHNEAFPSLYRVHEQPAADNLAALIPAFQEFSWFDTINQRALVAGDPFAIQAVLAASVGRAEEELVSSLVLRSMKRALYKPECQPHYGLASKAYTHFTSPIRRYPDLVVHRMLRAQLTRKPEKFNQEVAALSWMAEHASAMEREADAAARESQEVKMIEYLETSVGQAFSAVVSGVATYGLYVRLENTAEGLIHVRDLGNEYFSFDATRHQLTGEETGVVYRLGQRLAVVLVAANAQMRRLDFRLAQGK